MRPFDYQLASEFIDPEAEKLVLRVLAARGEIAGRWSRQVKAEHFAEHSRVFAALREGEPLERAWGEIAEADWKRDASDEESFLRAVERLSDLERRRELASLQEKVAEALFDREKPVTGAYTILEEGVRKLSRSSAAGVRVESGSELARQVLAIAEKRLAQRRATGKPVMGTPSGLAKLDQMLNGWVPGLHVLAAGPGVGKTTLCLQFAWHAAAEGWPVLYVTYENAARNILLKMLCARAGLSPADVERGFADMEKLEAAEREHAGVLERIHVIEGDGRLRLSAVEAAMRALAGGKAPGLIVFDYLQRAAHGLGYEQLRQNVSLLTGELRELSTRLDCPLIAISSQNRAQGDYGNGGSGALDSLKESGDLEYGADTVSLLYTPKDAGAAPPAREIELKVAKNRFGATGAVRLIFRPDTGVFREKA
jgi:replicative DNA helicase